MTSLTLAQTLFTLFFAIFWGGVANVQGRYKPFGFFGPGNHDAMRILISVILLNFLPIVYFIVVFFMLSSPDWSIPPWSWIAIRKTFVSVLATLEFSVSFALRSRLYRHGPNGCMANAS